MNFLFINAIDSISVTMNFFLYFAYLDGSSIRNFIFIIYYSRAWAREHVAPINGIDDISDTIKSFLLLTAFMAPIRDWERQILAQVLQ